MARLVYASRFEIPAGNGNRLALLEYGAWITDWYRNRMSLADFGFDPLQAETPPNLPNNHLLISRHYSDAQGTACHLTWGYPSQNGDGLRWINEIRIGEFDHRSVIEHQILVESVEYTVAPARLLFGSPRVVRDICSKATAFVGEMQLRPTPYQLRQGGLADFLTLLESEKRRLPIVLLSPYSNGDQNLIDADQIARNLAGVAVVVEIAEPEITWDFADEVGRQLSCFNGGARVYWPGFSRSDNPLDHRLYIGTWIEQRGAVPASGAIQRTIFSVAAFRFVPDQRISDVVRAAESAERQARLATIASEGDEGWKDYAVGLEEELTRAQEDARALRDENRILKDNQRALFAAALPGGEADDAEPSGEPVDISTVSQALEEASKRSKNLVILPTANSSARDSPFQRPFDIYSALVDLDQIVDAWRESRKNTGNGGDLLQHLRDRGWGKRSSMHISDTTRSRHGSSYEFDYADRKQLFEPHITIGSGDPNSCASIHFLFDQAKEKIVVAHVGKHLPNTRT